MSNWKFKSKIKFEEEILLVLAYDVRFTAAPPLVKN